MFKKTRNRIMWLNMIMVSAVVVAAFAAVYTISYLQVRDSNRERHLQLSMASMTVMVGSELISDDYMRDYHWSSERSAEGEHVIEREGHIIFGPRFWSESLIRPDYGMSFSLLADNEGNLIRIRSGVDLSEDVYKRAAYDAMNSGSANGVTMLEGRRWQYAVSDVHVALFLGNSDSDFSNLTYSNINYMDVTDSHNMLVSLALTLSGLTLVILVFFLFISRFFANRAVRPMEDAFERQSRFVADASHELKTPLAVINANCGVMYSNKDETMDSQIRWVDSIMRAASRMNGLIRDMLSLASIDESKTNLIIEQVKLSEAIEEAIVEIETAAMEKDVIIERHIEPDIVVEDAKEHILKIVNVYLDNAVKYTDNGGNISVSLHRDKRTVILAVKNTGDGIPQEDLERVFDRFYRSDPSRSSESGDYGLGLAIAKAAAECIGAKLSVHSTPGELTEFCLVL